MGFAIFCIQTELGRCVSVILRICVIQILSVNVCKFDQCVSLCEDQCLQSFWNLYLAKVETNLKCVSIEKFDGTSFVEKIGDQPFQINYLFQGMYLIGSKKNCN